MLNKKIIKQSVLLSRRISNLSSSAKGLLVLIGLVFVSLTFYSLLFLGRIYPGISIAQIEVSGKKPGEVAILLSSSMSPPKSIQLKTQDQSFEIPLEEINFAYDFPRSSFSAYRQYRSGNVLFDTLSRLLAPAREVNLGLRMSLDEEKLSEHLSVIAGQVAVEPVNPGAQIVRGRAVIEKGKPGVDVDIKQLRVLIGQNLAYAKNTPILIPTKTVDPTLNDPGAENYKKRTEKFIDKVLTLEFEGQIFAYEADELVKLINPTNEYNQAAVETLVRGLSEKINREPENPVLVFRESRVKEFSPAKEGIKTKVPLLKNMIIEKLRTLESSDEKTATIKIPVEITPPDIKTGDINNLGINELLGRGTSRFTGSIASRVHNISLSSLRFNGVLVKPGEIFSFNDTLGDVSAYTGYKQAYIIRDGKTILGDGGGVCQVSTTLFRAILNAGLPVVERRAHSYRVSYYEQDSPPGLDATVFAPTTDLKFKNDTPGHLLIQTGVDPKSSTLVFEIYGTDDGRVAKISKPVITAVTAPPEDLYQDDPTLPAGTIKQIDFKAWGAKVNFDYEVTRNGEIIFSKTFYSNFRPWQAVYLRGTGPVN